MVITAKYASVCPGCSVRITAGSKVEWTKGSPARHVACVGLAAVAAAPKSSGPRRRRSRPESGPGSISYKAARRDYARTGDYYGSGMYDEES